MAKEKLTMSENIRALELVLESEKGPRSPFISMTYMTEKLEKIRNGTVIFHPSIIEAVKDERKRKRKAK